MSDIFTACVNNDLILLDKIIKERPADINLVNGGDPILIKAIVLNRDTFAEKLIEAGANVNIKNFLGETPLIKASALNREGIAKLLTFSLQILEYIFS